MHVVVILHDKWKVKTMTVNVLGVEYTIKESNKLDDPILENNDGYCDYSTKTIVIDTFTDSPNSMKDLESYRKH